MGSRVRGTAGVMMGVWLILTSASVTRGQAQATDPTAVQREAILTTHATGTFDVKLVPLTTSDSSEGTLLGRFSIDKQWLGDLEGTSRGEMLTGATGVKGSAGYVAIERVSGTLHGRRGSFILQHSGTMARGVPKLTITVVPDSGTDELVGITGTLMITIADGKHSYDFEYTLSDAR